MGTDAVENENNGARFLAREIGGRPTAVEETSAVICGEETVFAGDESEEREQVRWNAAGGVDIRMKRRGRR